MRAVLNCTEYLDAVGGEAQDRIDFALFPSSSLSNLLFSRSVALGDRLDS